MLQLAKAEDQRQKDKDRHHPQAAGAQGNDRAERIKPGAHPGRRGAHQEEMDADNAAIDRQLKPEATFVAVDKGGNADKKGDDADPLGQPICGHESSLREKNKRRFTG